MAAKKMTEEVQFKSLLKEFGIPFKVFSDSQFICEDAIGSGAVISYYVGNTDWHFDRKGRFVGTSGEAINSFQKRLCEKKKSATKN